MWQSVGDIFQQLDFLNCFSLNKKECKARYEHETETVPEDAVAEKLAQTGKRKRVPAGQQFDDSAVQLSEMVCVNILWFSSNFFHLFLQISFICFLCLLGYVLIGNLLRIFQPKGRAILVKGSIGERKPSMDIKCPRHQDSDVVIQVCYDF